jgi:hypothetical protein
MQRISKLPAQQLQSNVSEYRQRNNLYEGANNLLL